MSTTTANPETIEIQTPAWMDDLRRKYIAGVAHAFLLHGNIGDMVALNTSVLKYLFLVFKTFDIIVVYDRAHGLEFPLASMREAFIDALDLKPKAPNNPMLAQMGLGQPQQQDPLEPFRAPAAALALLDRFLRLPPAPGQPPKKFMVIINHAETIVPASDSAQMSPEDRTAMVMVSGWGNDRDIAATGRIVFLTTPSLTDIHAQVRSPSNKYEAYQLKLPDAGERLAFIESIPTSIREKFEWRMTTQELAYATASLSRTHLLDLVRRAGLDGYLDRAMVNERRKQITLQEYEGVMEARDPRFGWEAIGGLDHIKSFLNQVAQRMRAGKTRLVPAGIMFLGPAGTGKSAVAEAFAKECGVNFAQIYLGQLLGKYVGDSESNLERLLQALEALAPVVVFADELDQQMRRSEGGDNSVERNMFGRLLAFMADPGNHGRILWLGASNRPDLMDAALMRPGRFDVSLVFPPPASEERRAIMHIFAKQQGLDVDQIPDEAVTATEGWTGAELANAMRKAALLVDADNMPPATAVIEATRRILAKTKDIDWMLKLALETANDTDLIPERLLPLMANRDALRREVRAGIEEREREFAPRSL